MERVDAVEAAPTADTRPTILKYFAVGLAWLGVALGAVLFGAALWIRRTFGPISIDQMLMHLPGAGGGEVTGAETGYISSFVWQALVIPLGIVLISAIAIHFGLRYLRRNHRRFRAAERPRPKLIRRVLPGLLAVGAFLLGGAVFAQAVNLSQYVQSAMTLLSMDDYYVAPQLQGDTRQVVSQEPGAPATNLVVIYLESIETAFAEQETFEANLLEPVEVATQDWASIPELLMYEGGGWTMAGIVGTQCGVPLRGSGIGVNDINSNEIGADASAFLPEAVCLGDVLAAEGYTNVFLGGADASFASKGSFLRGHGYADIKDRDYWLAAGETELSDWGLSDRALMEQAKAEVTRLHESGQPFNLTMLTLDSHEPVHYFEYCESALDNPMSDVIRCSMLEVASFIEYMEDSGYLDDTVVVLMGDHPKMIAEGGYYWDELASRENRPLFNRVWAPSQQPSFVDQTDQLSVFATMLDLLGFELDSRRAGVGVSALADTPWEALGLSEEKYSELIRARSASLYERLWGVESDDAIQAIGED